MQYLCHRSNSLTSNTRNKQLLKRSGYLQAAVLIALSSIGSSGLTEEGQVTERPTQSHETVTVTSSSKKSVLRPNRAAPLQNAYILGPGDSIAMELLDVPEYSGVFSISPDGTIYFPRLRSLYVEGYTVEELQNILIKEFSTYVRDPQIFLSIVTYRPIRVYVGGEVPRPGYYYLSEQQIVNRAAEINESDREMMANKPPNYSYGVKSLSSNNQLSIDKGNLGFGLRLPTVYDALRAAGGVTPFSKLSEVSVTRKAALSNGGGKIRTKLNFLELITDGDETNNIRLFDGDVVKIARSPVELRDQIIKASQTNLTPDHVLVYVTGRVRDPGAMNLPQGATLDQALAAAGGQKLLRGQVEFVRFNRDGSTDKRKFFVGGTNPSGSYKNPVLMHGDVVRVNESPISATLTVLQDITAPALGIYSVYGLIND